MKKIKIKMLQLKNLRFYLLIILWIFLNIIYNIIQFNLLNYFIIHYILINYNIKIYLIILWIIIILLFYFIIILIYWYYFLHKNFKELYIIIYTKLILNKIISKLNIIYFIILPILSSLFLYYSLIKNLYFWSIKIKIFINNINLIIEKLSDNLYLIYDINHIILLIVIIFYLILLILSIKLLINYIINYWTKLTNYFIIHYNKIKIKKININNIKIINIIKKLYIIIISNYKLSLFKSLLIKYILINYNEDLLLIIKEMINNKSDSLLSSNSDTESEIIEIETEEHKDSMKSIYFENFKNLSQKEKFNYIYQKMYNKAIEPNKDLIEWLINSTLNNTNGNKLEIDNYIDFNLNKIQKNERESQLMTHAFERTRPYPITRIDPSPHAFPVYMPMKKDMDDWDSQELNDAMNEINNINKEYEENEDSSIIKDSTSKSITIESNNEQSQENIK